MYVVSVATSQKGVTAARGRGGGGGAEGWMENRERGEWWWWWGVLGRDEHYLADSTPVFAGIIRALGGALWLRSQTG